MPYIELYADSSRGIYIPQYFAETYNKEKWCFKDCYPDSLGILLDGPQENDEYWEAWQDILDYAETKDGWTLNQDGDLWVVNLQGAIDDLNEFCQTQLEYETEHQDAGNNYSHMPAESWIYTDTKDLIENLVGPEVLVDPDCWEFDKRYGPKWIIDPMGLEPDEIADLALDIFTMERGSIFGCYTEGIILAAYPVQEVEIEIPEQFKDILEFIVRYCEATIANCHKYAYMATDAVWFAMVNPDELQQAIKERVEGSAKECL